ITYFTSGVSWAADYVAEVAPDEQSMKLNGDVKVTNKSGEDYENAQVRLVVGVIRLIEKIADLSGPKGAAAIDRLARQEYKKAMEVEKAWDDGFGGGGGVGGMAQRKDVAKERLSEYYLYTVEGRDTIPSGWSKKLPSFSTTNVAFTSYYKYEKEQYGDQVNRFYNFTNNVAGNLGKEPLPDGNLYAFRLASDDGLYSFQGASSFKYIPVNEMVELNLGPDSEVRIHPKLVSWEKQDLRFDNNGNVTGWTLKETWEIELQNSRAVPAVADVRRTFHGDWTVSNAAAHEQVDANKIKFLVKLDAHSSKTISYQLTTRMGTNATR
ncbi:MAG: hypothetical protein JWM04_1658, partial [Verrucomicrobiales bacterium]|nr:hypothetical protein [Verrucomicrobiales bacterium]